MLVDTHAWLWMLAAPDRLPVASQRVLDDPATDVLVSAVSTWEIAIKHGLGKLVLPGPPATYVPDRLRASGCTVLDVTVEDGLIAGALPLHHRDPFDRMLIAQAQVHGLPLCSGDRAFDGYDVEVLRG